MRSGAIIIDLDDVLIDTTGRIKLHTFRVVRQAGVPLRRMAACYRMVRGDRVGFTPWLYATRLAGRDLMLERRLRREFGALFVVPRQYNYPGVETFLWQLGRRYALVLVTAGDRNFQLMKLRQSGLRGYFREVAVVQSNDAKAAVFARLRRQYDGRMLILDDSPAVVAMARRKNFPVVRVAKRKGSGYYNGLFRRVSAVLARSRAGRGV
jgi:FMN phosphatase YigB (HAD superfamily)